MRLSPGLFQPIAADDVAANVADVALAPPLNGILEIAGPERAPFHLEGSVVMQLKGGQQVTLTPGQTFYEGHDDVHLVDRNASGSQPAKFLVFLIKNKGAPALVPAE